MATFSKYTNSKDGKKYWSLQAYLGTDVMTGKPVRVTRRRDARDNPFKTKKSAQREASRLMEDFKQKGLKRNDKTITFDDVYYEWVTKVYKKSVKDNTLVNVQRRVEMYVMPHFSGRLVNKIDKRFCDDVMHEWSKSDFKDVKRLIGLVERVFDYAMYIEVINFNPMAQLYVPPVKKKSKKDVEFFEREELTDFLEVAYKHGDKWGALFHFIAFTGCRKGEAIALEWKDIDWKKKKVKINKTLTKLGKGTVLHDSTKNGEERTISLDDFTLNKLKQWHKESVKTNVMFPSDSQTYLYPDTVNTTMKRILKKMSCTKHVTPHGLRHTHCSLLFAAGCSIKEVQKRLGHKTTKVTLDIYAHVTKDDERKTADAFQKYVNQLN